MTGTEKYTWGIVLGIVGALLLTGGLALSFTLIGACIGVPMALIGLPLMIWGAVWAFQGQAEKQRETIEAGVREGIRASQVPVLEAAAAVASTATSVEASEPSDSGKASEQEEPKFGGNDTAAVEPDPGGDANREAGDKDLGQGDPEADGKDGA